ncbi:single-stranded DNA-binding protein [Rubrobacter aplysinae]|uniref:single-stranded DNA-binding protein n=1 Tax=Rubrobacter aplysinae TaxID=909625 RepID=UPI00064BDAE1|nr:single-stranded DNA-binding protein [Rubrobacter aplysinae]
MVSFNRVVLAGNLTRDPELRFTNNGVPVCGFGIAVNRVRSKNEEVDFFDISAWRELGETIANYKKKGDPILIEGRLQFRSWEAQDGSKRNKVDVVADNIQFLGRSDGSGDGSGGGQGGQQSQSQGSRDNVEFNEQDFDDIPF